MDALKRDIMQDMEAGETLLSLAEARKDKRLLLDGRPHDLPWIHRAATKGLRGISGHRVILETIYQSGRRLTTYSAITRLIHRQATGEVKLKPRVADAAMERAAIKKLAAHGI